jgi:hypothetical protein
VDKVRLSASKKVVRKSVVTEDQKWTRTFCAVGLLLILAGALFPLFGFAAGEDFPWFAPIVLGIVAFTFGLTFKDASDNDSQE